MTERSDPRRANRLADETSPYLLQHAHNPVDWYPWGDEALQRARDEDRLILLSIGYSACHWCHVMERESFENDDIAEAMNARFVNIKVDREERPDLDDIYMAATVALNAGNGGWPMTVFLTPGLEPVFAGTYFPPQDVAGRPGFLRVLTQISDAWTADRTAMRESAARITQALREQRAQTGFLNVGLSELHAAADQFASDFDAEHGGFGRAPKFPPAVGLMLLLRLHKRFNDPHALSMVTRTLDAMGEGGMYDHLGGGFARYSTDRYWLVPHFEKMLYDNALLVRAYLEGWQVTGNEAYRRVATETLDYVLREMTDQAGGFFSSTDADSEGVEGKFFVWQPDEVVSVLGEADARIFNAYYDVSPRGNWEGSSVLHTPRAVADLAKRFDLRPRVAEERIASMRDRMYAARELRVKPGRDDKILTAWNGLMISACAEGYRVLGDARYLEAGRRAAAFLADVHVDDQGRLLRTSRDGRAHLNGYLEDYASLCEGLVDLYEVSGERAHLDAARGLADDIVTRFTDSSTGAFFHTANDHETLLMRFRDGTDGATPSPNAVAASALLRAGRHLDRSDLRDAATRALMAYGPLIHQFPRGFAKSLMVVDCLLDPPIELALVAPDEPAAAPFREVLRRLFLPNRVQAVLLGTPSDLPLLAGKTPGSGAALYICRNYACSAPISDPRAVAEGVGAVAPGLLSPTIAVRRAGYVTPEGTLRFAERFPSMRPAAIGDTGIMVSRLGYGAYRADDVTPDHRESLERAIASGVNLIDTSTNYMDGGSERMIGEVLGGLLDAGDVLRDEIVVVSKIGYIQGTNYAMAKARDDRGEGFPQVTRIGDGLWHCIHPEFLEDQLQRSLDRLQLETLDVCLLHNPEYFLSYGEAPGGADGLRDEFYRRLTDAFRYFESQVTLGRIQWYGVSSNTVAGGAKDREATSLERMVGAAVTAGGTGHAFRVLQLPINLFESNAVLPPDGTRGVLETALASGVAVFANRPLNAFIEREMVRLADFVASDGELDVVAALRRLTGIENEYRDQIAARINAPKGALSPAEYFQWAGQLEMVLEQTVGMEQWAQVDHQIRSGIGHFAGVLDRNLRGPAMDTWRAWRERYSVEVGNILSEIRRRAVNHAASRSAAVSNAVDALFPEERAAETLSRKALWTVMSAPGVTSVLTGMRTPSYVADATEVLSWAPIEAPEEVFGAVRAAPYLRG